MQNSIHSPPPPPLSGTHTAEEEKNVSDVTVAAASWRWQLSNSTHKKKPSELSSFQQLPNASVAL